MAIVASCREQYWRYLLSWLWWMRCSRQMFAKICGWSIKISPVGVNLQAPQFDDKDIGPSRKSIKTLDPPLEGAAYDLYLAWVSVFDYLDPHMKYWYFHFYDAAFPHAYVYDTARTVTTRTVTRYALCSNFLRAYCILLLERSKTWLAF